MSVMSISQFMWPPLAEYLLRHFSLTGTLLIFAGVQLHGSVFGALIRPFALQSKLLQNRRKKVLNPLSNTTSNAKLPNIYVDHNTINTLGNSVSWQVDSMDKQEYQSYSTNRSRILVDEMTNTKTTSVTKSDIFGVLKNRHFIMFSIAIVLAFFGENTEFLYLTKVGVQVGGTKQQGAFLVSILSEYFFHLLSLFRSNSFPKYFPLSYVEDRFSIKNIKL